MKNNSKKTSQLGVPIGTASNRLKKQVMFHLIQRLGEDNCYRCKKKIESSDHLSIEHKVPYLDSENPKELFFQIDNIAFSHLKCNTAARRSKNGHPSEWEYRKGCRCQGCKDAHALERAKERNKKK